MVELNNFGNVTTRVVAPKSKLELKDAVTDEFEYSGIIFRIVDQLLLLLTVLLSLGSK
jgi:hypothetical protein